MKIRKIRGIEYVYDNKNQYVGRKDKFEPSLIDKAESDIDDLSSLREIAMKNFSEILLSTLYGMRDDVLSDPNKYGLDSPARVDKFFQSWYNHIAEHISVYGVPIEVLDRLEAYIRASVKSGRFSGKKITQKELLLAMSEFNKEGGDYEPK